MGFDEKRFGVGAVVVSAALGMLAGAACMAVSCLFMWSREMIDVIGAGMGMLTGAILFGSGVIALALVANTRNLK